MSPSVRNVSSSNPRHSARSVKKEESLGWYLLPFDRDNATDALFSDHDLQSLPVSDHASELSSSALLEALSLWDIDVPLGTEEESRLKANGDIKRPRNAFMWFRSIFERERKRRNPNVRHTNQCDVSSEAANRWRAMTAGSSCNPNTSAAKTDIIFRGPAPILRQGQCREAEILGTVPNVQVCSSG